MFDPFRRVGGVAVATLLALACSPPAGEPSAPGAAAPSAPEVAAELNGQQITVPELDEWIKDALMRQATRDNDANALYEVRRLALNNIIQQRLLEAEARARGTDTETLLAEEVEKRAKVEDADVDEFYEQNKERLQQVEPEEAKPRIRTQLEQQRREAASNEFHEELRNAAQLEIALEPPRTTVAAQGPARGPEDAPITVIEFSDYQCPFCRRAEPTVKQLLERYPDQIRFVFRHFPLDAIHPRARPAAEAAVCADKQGNFWSYHEALFTTPQLEAADLQRIATEVGLDVQAFTACLADASVREAVEADLVAGREAGVSGTPAFFVNGIRLSGARPLDDFVELVEGELQRTRPGTGS